MGKVVRYLGVILGILQGCEFSFNLDDHCFQGQICDAPNGNPDTDNPPSTVDSGSGPLDAANPAEDSNAPNRIQLTTTNGVPTGWHDSQLDLDCEPYPTLENGVAHQRCLAINVPTWDVGNPKFPEATISVWSADNQCRNPLFKATKAPYGFRLNNTKDDHSALQAYALSIIESTIPIFGDDSGNGQDCNALDYCPGPCNVTGCPDGSQCIGVQCLTPKGQCINPQPQTKNEASGLKIGTEIPLSTFALMD